MILVAASCAGAVSTAGRSARSELYKSVVCAGSADSCFVCKHAITSFQHVFHISLHALRMVYCIYLFCFDIFLSNIKYHFLFSPYHLRPVNIA